MIVKAEIADAWVVAQLAGKMWVSHTIDDLTREFEELLADPEAAVFLYDVDGKAVGFAQCQLRHDYVEGTEHSPVGYLEGIYVEPDWRRNGIAGKLLSACESWARQQGCREFASDCEITNSESLQFHLGLGFTEANRIICFTKKL